jgi:hypothetical protein
MHHFSPNMSRVSGLVATLLLWCGSGVAHAALSPLGNGLINSPDQGITWVADANLFHTLAAADPSLVSNIISAWTVGPFQLPPGATYTLTAADFDPAGGQMTWFGAQAWINYLNVTNYLGYSDWRLPYSPEANEEACGGACYPTPGQSLSRVDFWELFFNELGGVVAVSITTTHNSSYALFSNVQTGGYWGGAPGFPSTLSAGTDLAAVFGVDASVGSDYTTNTLFSWIVRTGLSVVSPPPMSYLTFSPSSLVFPGQVDGTTSTAQTITVMNTGTGPATFASVAATGDFSVTNNCPDSLAAGASCTLGVQFGPTSLNALTGILTVTAGTAYNIALSGTSTLSVTLTSSASTVDVNQPVSLTWTSSGSGATCTSSGGSAGDQWNGTRAASGSTSVMEGATGTYTYVISCTEDSQSAQASVKVLVNPAPSGGGGGMIDLWSLLCAAGLCILRSRHLSLI